MNKNKSTGFTIVELLIVVVVIAILAAITIVSYNGITGRANDSTVQANLRDAAQKIMAYNVIEGAYPSDPSDLDGLVSVNAEAYSGTNRFIYCWRGGTAPRFAVAGRSKTGTGFYYSSRDGLRELDSWHTGSVDLCNATGITQPGAPYNTEWLREWGYTNNWAWWVDV